MNGKYKVNEIFYSLQGEGFYAGSPAVFIRFSGCNLRCPFCDTNWKEGKEMTVAEIVKEAQAQAKALPELVILTGGEPTLQVDELLLERLHTKFKIIAMETNGTKPIPKGIDYVTVSPKDDYVATAENIVGNADEIKVVFDAKRNPEFWHSHILAKHYFLQPCDVGNDNKNKEIREKCVSYIKLHPWWRLSLQTQKILGIR